MKKNIQIIFVIICILCSIQNVRAWDFYANDNGVFKLLPANEWKDSSLPEINGYKPGSIGYVFSKMGYSSAETYMYIEGDDTVIFKAFSQTPLFLLIGDGNDEPVYPKEKYDELIRKFNYSKEFDPYRAMENGTIRQSFMEETLGKKAENNMIRDDQNRFIFFFKDGLLDRAEPLDGLGKYARWVENSRVFEIIKSNSEEKHPNDREAQLKEINFQCYCLSNMTEDLLKRAMDRLGNYNFAVTWFTFMGSTNDGKLSDFELCVPEAETILEEDDIVLKMWRNRFTYKFKNGVLVECKSSRN